ncbi:MAG: hypothetical protein IK143_00655, partial [Bacteroidales bacterium]|nr:hypothetical protein [Bacteroidales bacterium]
EFSKLQGLEHVTLNTVGYKKHHSHFSLDEAVALADRIGARHTWLTHLSHSFPPYVRFDAVLADLSAGLRTTIHPAYDGLTIED